MVSLYLFGRTFEWSLGKTDFLLIYFGSVIGGSLLSLYVHRHHDYLAYGASGGVCGIIFAYLLLFPGAGISLYFAVPIPGWLYAIGFMVGSFIALKQAKDNIGHDAHLGGAIVGLLIAAGLHPQAAAYNWKIFLLVLVPAILLLVYLWLNPLFLPTPSFFDRPFRARTPAVETARTQTGEHAGGCPPRQDSQERGGQPDRRREGFAARGLRQDTGAGRSPRSPSQAWRFDRHCQSAAAPIS